MATIGGHGRARRARLELVRSGRVEDADDRTLAERAAVDRDAFGELYRRYVRSIHRFARRGTGSAAAADDVCGSTFEHALEAIGRFRWRDGGFSAWIHRIAAREIAAFHRERSRHQTQRARQIQIRNQQLAPSDPAEVVIEDLDGVEVRAAIARLRPRYQECLWLRYYADLDPATAAEVLGSSRGAESVLVHRALRALGNELASLREETRRDR